MKRLILDAFLLMLAACLIGFSVLMFLPLAHPQESSGDITFQPSVIPSMIVSSEVGRNNESFRFKWLGNSFDIELFFNATIEKKGVNVTKLWSLHDFEVDFNVSVSFPYEKNKTHCRFGWFVENTEVVTEYIHNAWFKIEDTKPFDYDHIEIRNDTYVLPDNLFLSFYDLEFKGFVIGWQNKTSTSVKGFSGKASWNLDPIIYSGNIIYVGQDSSDLFEDIYNADVAGGWNVFHKQGTQQYLSDTRIVINATYTASDIRAQIEFNSTAVTANNQYYIEVKTDAQLTFGVLDDVATKRGSRGVSFYAYDSRLYTRFIYGENVQLYGCKFLRSQTSSYDKRVQVGSASYNAPVWHCVFDYTLLTGYVDAYDLIFTKGQTALSSAYGVMDTLHVFGQTRIVGWGGLGVDGFTIRNVVGRGNTYMLSTASYSSANIYLVNFDVDTWAFTWGTSTTSEIYRQYEFDLIATYPNGTAMANANVTIYNAVQGKVSSFLTFANGSIPTQTLTMGFYNQTGGNTLYSYNPYHINATSPDGEYTYYKNWTLHDKADWEIALLPTSQNGDGATFNSVYYLLGGISLLPFSLLFALLLSRRQKNGSEL